MTAIPRHVIVFSGHLVDEQGREPPRFPNDEDTIGRVRRAIDEALGGLAAGADDLALTQGACGGDLLFSALCLERGAELRWLQPSAEDAFIASSVARGGARWRALYAALRESLGAPPQAMPAALGRAVEDAADPFRRCNRWLLDTARAYGVDKLRFVALWDFNETDAAGGTAGMIDDARRLTTSVVLIDMPAPAAPAG